jgi:MOSC domain-containing protein YiiM
MQLMRMMPASASPELDDTEHETSFSSSSSWNGSEEPSQAESQADQDTLHDLDQDHNQGASLTLTVQGLFTKRVLPGLRFLPKDYKTADLNKHQFMCRKRIRTRHVTDNTRPPPLDDSSSGIPDEQEYDSAMFVPKTGLINGFFWHTTAAEVIMEDRAILFQSTEHYEQLQQDPQFKSCFDDIDYMDSPSFGEQVIVKGCDSSQLAIGDVFQVEGGLSPLVVEITSPRKPCSHVNKRHGSSNGMQGMKRHALTHCLAGWFARVLVAGELQDGMKLVRTNHPNPKWTLSYISKALYTQGSQMDLAMCRAHWNGEKSELEELVSLPSLCEYEWKVEARKLLMKWDTSNSVPLPLPVTRKTEMHLGAAFN